MVIFGTRLFGKVDVIPGLGFVATRFFHIDYVPLIPTEGWLVFQHTGKNWQGIRVPISAKSIMIAWLRTASVVAIIGGVIGLIINGSDAHSQPVSFILCGVVVAIGGGIFAFSKMHKSVTHASYARACELGRLAKLNERGMAAIAAVYGQPPMSFGFEPLPVAPMPVAALPGRPGAVRPLPVAALPIEDDVEVESIPLEELETSAAANQQPLATPMPIGAMPGPLSTAAQPRQEVRRHG